MRLAFTFRNRWVKIFLFIAFLNAVLKINPDSDITLFRLLLPIAAIHFFLRRASDAVNFFFVTSVFFALQFISWIVSDYPISYLQFAFTGSYLTIIFLFFYVRSHFSVAPEDFFKFLRNIYILLIVFLSLQYLFEIRLPNTNDWGLNAWYWNQNDASLALAGFFILGVRAGVSIPMLFAHFLALVLMGVNGSRAALWGSLVYAVVWYFIVWWRFRLGGVSYRGVILFALGLIVMLLALPYYKEGLVDAASSLGSAVKSVLDLTDDANSITSFGVRSNAMIYALHEFGDSYGLGIGAGNSIAMLQSNKYAYLSLVKSIHNMPMQMLLELGLPLMFILLAGLWRSSRLHWFDFSLLVVIFAFVSLTQSGGFIVNYFPLVCFYVAVMMPAGFIGMRRSGARSMQRKLDKSRVAPRLGAVQ